MVDNRKAPSCVEAAGPLPECTQGDEAGSAGHRSAAHRRRAHAQAQGAAGRGGAPAGCRAAGRQRVGAAGGRGQRRGGQAQGQAGGPTQAAGRRAARGAVAAACGRCAAGRLCHRAVDGQAGALGNRARVWRGVQPDQLLGVAAQSGFLAAQARPARHAARRAGDPEVEAPDLARAQKKPAARAEPSSS